MWFAPLNTPVRLPVLFALLTLIPAAALGGLTLDLLQKDRELEKERLRERLENAADRAVAASHQRLADLERWLEGAEPPPSGVVRVTVAGDDISVNPPGALAYYPDSIAPLPSPDGAFAEGERYEYRERNLARAIAWYASLADRSQDIPVRGGALVRLGRAQQNAGEIEAALATYDPPGSSRLGRGGGCAGRSPRARGPGHGARTNAPDAGTRGNRHAPRRAPDDRRLGAPPDPLRDLPPQPTRWSGRQATEATVQVRNAAAFVAAYERWTAEGAVPSRAWSLTSSAFVAAATAPYTTP